jgi:adenosylcobinamide-phosphate synthase
MPGNILITSLALVLEACFGYPNWLFRAIGHPVTWIGTIIDRLEHALNRKDAGSKMGKSAGGVAVAIVIGASGVIGLGLQVGLSSVPLGTIFIAAISASLLAQRSLHSHVQAVALALEKEGLEGGRRTVAPIVGRDPDALDEAGVARAAIESLAENFSDGVVAPAFWLGLGGLPAACIYKAINTADSMIGHRTPRYRHFGYAAARIDDFVNLPASRISAVLLILAAACIPKGSASGAWISVRRDAHRHRSPNAGYPEAAMAGALGLSLAGPRVYGGELVDDATMGEGRRSADSSDIRTALSLYRVADGLFVALVGGAAAATVILQALAAGPN